MVLQEFEAKGLIPELVTSNSTEVLILAGGKGSRLKKSEDPELRSKPKLLVSINRQGTPVTMLDNVILDLTSAGFSNISLLTSEDPESGGAQIEDHASQNYFDLKINISREPRPLGTAGATNKAIRERNLDIAVVTPGDTLFPFHLLPDAVKEHKQKNANLTWVVTSIPGDNAQNTGRILVGVLDKKIKHCFEGTNIDPAVYLTTSLIPLTSVGVVVTNGSYFIHRYQEFINELEIAEPIDMYRQFIPWLLFHQEPIYTYDIKQPAPDLGTPDRLEEFGRHGATTSDIKNFYPTMGPSYKSFK